MTLKQLKAVNVFHFLILDDNVSSHVVKTILTILSQTIHIALLCTFILLNENTQNYICIYGKIFYCILVCIFAPPETLFLMLFLNVFLTYIFGKHRIIKRLLEKTITQECHTVTSTKTNSIIKIGFEQDIFSTVQKQLHFGSPFGAPNCQCISSLTDIQSIAKLTGQLWSSAKCSFRPSQPQRQKTV